MRKTRAAFCGLACAVLLTALSNDTHAAMAPTDPPALHAAPPASTAPDRQITIAQKKNKKQAGAKKQKRCKHLLTHCQYSTDRAFSNNLCTAQNVKFMQENCMGKK